MELNKVMLIGNLTRDPETRHAATGTQVTTFTIAVNDRSRGKQNETTMFIKVTTFNKTAEVADKYLRKGSQVFVEGKLQIDEYETKDGQKRRDPVVIANNITLGARPRDEQGGGGYDRGGSSGGYDRESRGASQARESGYSQTHDRYDDAPSGGDDPGRPGTEDDLPF